MYVMSFGDHLCSHQQIDLAGMKVVEHMLKVVARLRARYRGPTCRYAPAGTRRAASLPLSLILCQENKCARYRTSDSASAPPADSCSNGIPSDAPLCETSWRSCNSCTAACFSTAAAQHLQKNIHDDSAGPSPCSPRVNRSVTSSINCRANIWSSPVC